MVNYLMDDLQTIQPSEIQSEIQLATDTIARLNAFEEWLEKEAISGHNSPTYILERYRQARYET